MKNLFIFFLFAFASNAFATLTPQSGSGGGGGGTWGSILGDINDQIDLASGLDSKHTKGDRLYFPQTGQPNCIICFTEIGNDTGIGSDTDGDIYFESNNHVAMRLNGDNLSVLGNITAANYPPAPISGNNNSLAAYDNSGNITSVLNTTVNGDGFIDLFKTMQPNDGGQVQLMNEAVSVEPIGNTPDGSYLLHQEQISFDTANTGFNFGTSGNAAWFHNMGYTHQGQSDIGVLNYLTMNNNLGNGTDPIDVQGVTYVEASGNIAPGTTILGQVRGHGFSLNMQTGSFINQNISPFFDQSQVQTDVAGYSIFNGGPTISGIKNNSNFEGVSIHPSITNFTGNAGANVFAIGGSYGTFEDGTFNGIMVSPSVTSVQNAFGLYINMNDVNASGTKKAAVFNGDVDVNGALSFSGALSIGKLTAYAEQTVADGGGSPTTVNSLISAISIPDNDTTANIDTIGLNSAALFFVGENAAPTMGPFGLFAALALPAVIETHTGSVLPRIQGGVFALSFSGTSTGGTVTEAAAGRFTIIPNGITTVSRAINALLDNPFGNAGTENYGVYQIGAEKNYFQGALKVGGDDQISTEYLFEVDGASYLTGELTAKAGVKLATDGTQPTCDVGHRGTMWNVEGGSGVADVLQVCQKDILDAYVWTIH